MLIRVSQWMTTANITFWIAVISFFMSVASWAYTFATQRKRLYFRILIFKANEDKAYTHVLIENHSRLPIAITDIQLLQDKQTTHCEPLATKIYETTRFHNNEIIGRTEHYSTELPVEIGPLGAVNCLFYFQHLSQMIPKNATHLTLVICTNRGRKLKKKLQLPVGWSVPNTIS